VPEQNYDVIIIGGGMAGLTAGIYSARHGLSTAIVEEMMAGAQIINLERIENFPGFPQGIAGYELGPSTQEQAMDAGVEILMDTVTDVNADGDYLQVVGDGGSASRISPASPRASPATNSARQPRNRPWTPAWKS
jgi:thioredoxin reductase (NADPH)